MRHLLCSVVFLPLLRLFSFEVVLVFCWAGGAGAGGSTLVSSLTLVFHLPVQISVAREREPDLRAKGASSDGSA